MVFKKLIAAGAAVAMMGTSAVAAAQSVPTTEVAPASETVDEGSELRGGFIIPLAVIIAIILGLLALTDDGNDAPQSPG